MVVFKCFNAGINTNFSIYPSNATWEADVEYMCVCDSSWAAGYGSLNDPRVLATEWFGPDCSMRKSFLFPLYAI